MEQEQVEQPLQEVMVENPVADQIGMVSTKNMERKVQKAKDISGQVNLKRTESKEIRDNTPLEIQVHKDFKQLLETKVAISYLQQYFLKSFYKKLDQSSQVEAQSQSLTILQKEFQDLNQFMKTCKKTLMLRQSQLGSLLLIMAKLDDPTFDKDYYTLIEGMQQFFIPTDKIKHPLNFHILQEALQKEIQYLKIYKENVKSITNEFQISKQRPNTLAITRTRNKVKVLNTKIVTIAEIFPFACIIPRQDLFSFQKYDERWQGLFKTTIQYRIYGARDKVIRSFDKLRANVNIISASMNIYGKNKNLSPYQIKDWGKILESGSKILRLAIFKGEALQEAELFISEGNEELAKEMWNLPDNKLLKNLVAASLPSIKYTQKLYIPRIYTEYLKSGGKMPIPEAMIITNPTQYAQSLFKVVDHDERLMLRVNSSHTIRRIVEEKQQQKNVGIFNMSILTSVFKTFDQHTPKQLIFHVHGGGFVSMSTFVHQTYIRPWANDLGVPIISVEYGKAPSHPFPEGLYDCFEGYMWTLYCFRQVFHADPGKIVLVGDSAGGNLVAALTTMLIQFGLQKPDGIVLIYPALNLNFKNYTPSLLKSLNDMILPHTFLKVCLQDYLQDTSCKPQSDPYISPILTTDQILKKYPPTRMFVGSMDPFHDDCCRFAERMNNLTPGIVKLTVFQEFPHGFLQFDTRAQPHQYAKKATKQIEQAIKQLIVVDDE